MQNQIQDSIKIPVSDDAFIWLTTNNTAPNLIKMSPWQNGSGHGTIIFDKDTAIKLANRLLDLAGSGNK